MKVGDLVRYKNRYMGEQFIVVNVYESEYMWPKIKCVSMQTFKLSLIHI